MVIYEIVNIINGKKYIGKTEKDLEHRWKNHIAASKKVLKKVSKLYNAIKKYGIENFYCKVIKIVNDINLLNELEMYYIKKYNTINSGYNIAIGGTGGDTLSNHPLKEDIYKRCSETFKKNQSGWTNKQLPEEIKYNISKTLKEYYSNFTEEELVLKNQKTSESLKGRIFTEEHLQKLSDANKGEKNPMYGKKSWCNGLTKETSNTVKEAAEKISNIIKAQYVNGRISWNKGKNLGPLSIEEREKRCKKIWRITSNCGEVWITKTLRNWCEERNIKKESFISSKSLNSFKEDKWYKNMYCLEDITNG